MSETGTTFTHWRDDASGHRGLSIDRQPSANIDHYYRRIRTAERDHVLGEDCIVWRSEPAVARPYQSHTLTCETADGIQLWSRTLSSGSAAVSGWSRTVSFTRRPVSAAEVRPPRHLLRWGSWRELAPAAGAVTPASGPQRDYEVRLEGSAGREQARIFRASHGWSYSEVRGQPLRSITVRSDAVAIDYREWPAGGRRGSRSGR